MKKTIYSWAWLAVLAIVFSHQARADIIADTGTPTQVGSASILSDGQWLAVEFSIGQNLKLSSLEGFINADSGNPDAATFTLAIYSNGASKPDTSNELFSQQAIFTGDGWNGLHGLNWALDAGTYWLAFEVRSTDTLQGLMPVVAPHPLPAAWSDGSSAYTPVSGSSYNFGVRISSVPTPPALWLLVPGLLMMGLKRQRQAI